MIRELAEKKNPIGSKTKMLANFFKIGTPPFVKPFSSPPYLNGPSPLSLSLKSLNLLLSLSHTHKTLRSKWPHLCLHLRQCRRRILRRCNSHTDLNNNHHHHHHNNCHPWRCPCLLLLLISTPLLATTRTAASKNPSASCAPSNSLSLSLSIFFCLQRVRFFSFSIFFLLQFLELVRSQRRPLDRPRRCRFSIRFTKSSTHFHTYIHTYI